MALDAYRGAEHSQDPISERLKKPYDEFWKLGRAHTHEEYAFNSRSSSHYETFISIFSSFATFFATVGNILRGTETIEFELNSDYCITQITTEKPFSERLSELSDFLMTYFSQQEICTIEIECPSGESA